MRGTHPLRVRERERVGVGGLPVKALWHKPEREKVQSLHPIGESYPLALCAVHNENRRERNVAQRLSRQFNPGATPQSEPIPGSSQVPNSAGGYAWGVDDWERLHRFLILGTEGGTYYIKEQKLTRENGEAILRCLRADAKRTIKTIAEISESGRAPKNDPAVFALALCVAYAPTIDVKRAALDALPRVCRIGTHLFHFMQYFEDLRAAGQRYGRSVRRGLARWYQRDADKLADQVIKYAQRDGWAHRDVIVLSHPQPPSPAHAAVYQYAVRVAGAKDPNERLAALTNLGASGLWDVLPQGIKAFESLRSASDVKAALAIVRESKLPREAIEQVNTEWLKDKETWAVLLPHMLPEAMIRNLGVMTSRELLVPMSDATKHVISVLSSEEALRRARMHPLKVLAAFMAYTGGKGVRGSLAWTPVQKIVDALDRAFYMTFQNVTPSNKRILLALDVSGSMSWGEIAGMPGMTPRVAAGALALVTAATEPNHHIVGFSDTLRELAISPRQRLDQVLAYIDKVPMGGTDCSLPMLYASEKKLPIDAFIVLTDSETWAGRMHPSQALNQYRAKLGIPAKLIVVGMTSNGFSIADPDDKGMLDVVGFDTAVPALISDFIAR